MEKAIILTSNIAKKKKTSVACQFCFVIWICNDSPYFQLYCQPFFPLSSLFFSLSSDAHFKFKPLWVPCTFGLFTGRLYRLRRPENTIKKVVRISGWANYFLQASMGVIIHYCLTRLTFIHDHYLLKTTNIFIYYFFFTKKIIFDFNIYFFFRFCIFLLLWDLKLPWNASFVCFWLRQRKADILKLLQYCWMFAKITFWKTVVN